MKDNLRDNSDEQINNKPEADAKELQTVFDIWSSVKGLAKRREPVVAPQYHYSYNDDDDQPGEAP